MDLSGTGLPTAGHPQRRARPQPDTSERPRADQRRMSNDTDTTTRKPLKLSSPGKLELKKTVDGGQVRQSFPHGRTKTVAVEVKKKRTYTQGVGGKMTEVPSEAEQKLGLTPAAPVVEIDDRPHHT